MANLSKYLVAAILFTIVSGNLSAQQKFRHPTVKKADQVKQYWFVMLTMGNNRTQDSATAAGIQDGHMANIRRLYNDGKLKVAGPFGDDGNWRGIFIFDCQTKEELEGLLNTDPAIAAGRLAYEIHPWLTSPTGSFIPGKPANGN